MLTPAEEQFVRAIADDPGDDLCRLAYADWLEERGDPYGEFIRVQVQYARAKMDDTSFHALLDRQHELQGAAPLAAWKTQLARHGFGVDFRRGFVERFSLDLSRWPSLDATPPRFTARLPLPLLESLWSLLSADCRFTAAPARLVIWANVDDTSENQFFLPAEVAEGVLGLPCFARLDSLEINPFSVHDAGAAQAVLAHRNLGRLRRLSLSGHPVGASGCLALARAGALTSLTSLDLDSTGIDDVGTASLARAVCLAKLTELDLRDNRIGDSGAQALAASAHLGALKKLKLASNPIGPRGTEALRKRFGRACLLPQLQGAQQRRPGDWRCLECSATNFSSRDACYECHSPKPQPRLREGDWLCPACQAHNFARRQACHRCKGTRPT